MVHNILVETQERQAAQRLVEFVKGQMPATVEGRLVLAVEMLRLLKPEIDELRRRAGKPDGK